MFFFKELYTAGEHAVFFHESRGPRLPPRSVSIIFFNIKEGTSFDRDREDSSQHLDFERVDHY